MYCFLLLSLFMQLSTFDVCRSWFVFGWGFSRDIDIDCFSSLIIFSSWMKLIAYSYASCIFITYYFSWSVSLLWLHFGGEFVYGKECLQMLPGSGHIMYCHFLFPFTYSLYMQLIHLICVGHGMSLVEVSPRTLILTVFHHWWFFHRGWS